MASREFQAAIFKKILGLDKTLQANGRIEVAVVYGDVARRMRSSEHSTVSGYPRFP